MLHKIPKDGYDASGYGIRGTMAAPLRKLTPTLRKHLVEVIVPITILVPHGFVPKDPLMRVVGGHGGAIALLSS